MCRHISTPYGEIAFAELVIGPEKVSAALEAGAPPLALRAAMERFQAFFDMTRWN